MIPQFVFTFCPRDYSRILAVWSQVPVSDFLCRQVLEIMYILVVQEPCKELTGSRSGFPSACRTQLPVRDCWRCTHMIISGTVVPDPITCVSRFVIPPGNRSAASDCALQQPGVTGQSCSLPGVVAPLAATGSQVIPLMHMQFFASFLLLHITIGLQIFICYSRNHPST